MTHKIFETKERLVDELHRELEGGTDGADLRKVAEVVDMVKDLAEAEKCCWEACYYQSVVEAMDEERQGYSNGYSDGRSGNSRQGYDRMGYRNQYGNWPANPDRRGYTSRMMGNRYGYDGSAVSTLRDQMQGANEEDKRRMRQEIEQMLREM